jgi:hypothetical protein
MSVLVCKTCGYRTDQVGIGLALMRDMAAASVLLDGIDAEREQRWAQ